MYPAFVHAVVELAICGNVCVGTGPGFVPGYFVPATDEVIVPAAVASPPTEPPEMRDHLTAASADQEA